jgi:hypothetical protein
MTPHVRAAARLSLIAGFLALMGAAPARAADWPSAVESVFKQVVFDPTTYSPAITSYTAERLDWKSSQIFFEHGYVEHNPQFTISGFPDDIPVGYDAGKRIILRNALGDLGTSLIHNTAVRIIERELLERHPERQKLIRAIGWIERISFAVTLASIQSANHFRQWRKNEQLARELGYR